MDGDFKTPDRQPLRIDAPALTSPEAAPAVFAALRRFPYFCLIAGGIGDREGAEALCRALAAHDPENPDAPVDPERKVSYTAVRVKPNVNLVKGAMTAFSRTNRPMGYHTDSSYHQSPHDIVAFQMVQADAVGGDSLMVPVEHILERLDTELVDMLAQPVFPFGKTFRPILWQNRDGPCIRYYREQIETARAGGAHLDDKAVAAIDAIDAVLDDPEVAFRFRIEPGEILFMNNWRVLHGRTGFAPDSQRLMFRYRTRGDHLV